MFSSSHSYLLKQRLRICGILYLFLFSEEEESGVRVMQGSDCNDEQWNLECKKKK